jgi:hypothetical protein
MKFYRQNDDTSCQLVAVQTAMSYFDKFPSLAEIKKQLPKHSFGNLITELGIYLELQGIKTMLISNEAKIRPTNKFFFDKILEYKRIGDFQDRRFTLKDLDFGPVLVNVDWYKITNLELGKGVHYIVLLKVDNTILLYDGSNYNHPVKTTLNHIVEASRDINRWKDDGMFIVCKVKKATK